jgi:hypothetical protein
MPRLLVFVLAAANLLYFGWSQWTAKPPPELTAVAITTAQGGARSGKSPAPPPPCATLGPFADELAASQAEKLLAKSGWQPQRRAASEDVNDGWWVYVPTTSAASQARTLESIRRSGLRDAFAMTDDTEFRVSVGLFSEEPRAQDRAARVQKLKLDAVVKERYKQQAVTWFDLPGVAREALMAAHLDAAGLPLDVLRIEACPSDAAPANASPPHAATSAPPPQAAPASGAGQR